MCMSFSAPLVLIKGGARTAERESRTCRSSERKSDPFVWCFLQTRHFLPEKWRPERLSASDVDRQACFSNYRGQRTDPVTAAPKLRLENARNRSNPVRPLKSSGGELEREHLFFRGNSVTFQNIAPLAPFYSRQVKRGKKGGFKEKQSAGAEPPRLPQSYTAELNGGRSDALRAER
ncbi:hypothetical protein SRHO_G00249860 [Serrasalmus rhombeus]